MTTELEEQFYKTFGIEPTVYSIWDSKETQIKNFNSFEVYPEITDHRLLQMICILNDYEGINVKGNKIEELKEELLKQCIEYFKYPIAFEESNDLCNLHNHIQQLFKEEE